jgi:anti-sigma factor ChrR (cupin superfamily)
MITEQQHEQASLYAVGALSERERLAFELELRGNAELRELVRGLNEATALIAVSAPQVAPPARMKQKVLDRIASSTPQAPAARPSEEQARANVPGFAFVETSESRGWKELPVRGAWIKFLSIEPSKGYAVLLGRLEAGVRYPAHFHEGPEEIYLLTGDLHVGDKRLGPGDFHHSDAGTSHPVNYSEEGCTLLAVLPANHELVQFAMA